MTTMVTITDHRTSLSPVGLEDKPAGTRGQQLVSKPMELVRVGQSATAKGIKLASNAATVAVGKTNVALVPPSAANPPRRDSTMPRKRLQKATRHTPVTMPQPNREGPASNAAIASVGETKVAWVPPSTAAAAVAVQPAAATQAAKARPPAPRLRKALPPGSRAAKPAVTRAAHHNLFGAVGAPVPAAPHSAAAQSARGLAGGPGPGAAKVEDGMTEEWFESVAETATPYSLNLQQHRKLQELFIEHVARMWFHKRTKDSDARLRVVLASARCHDMVPEVLARLKIPFLVQVLYQHPNKFVSKQAELLNDSDDWKKALALMRKIAMKQLGLTKEHAGKIVANMVKNYSLPTTAAAAAAPSSKAPAAAQDEGGKADMQNQGGNAGRRGKRRRRSHLRSSPSHVKRPCDVVAPGEGMTLRDRAVQPAMKKPKTIQEMERSQLPAILGLQAVENPRQDDAVERRLPEGMTQADHASDVALFSDYQATPRVPAVSIAPGAQPQKRRPGRTPKKVKVAAQDPVGNQEEAAKRLAPVEAEWDLPSVARKDAVPEAQLLHLASGAAPVAQATAPGLLNEQKRARRLVPASVVDAVPGAPRPRGRPPWATPGGVLKRQQLRDAAQASGSNAGALLGLAGESLPARPSSTSARSGYGGDAGSSPRILLPVPAATAEELPTAAVAADQPAVPATAHEALDPPSAAEDLSDAGVPPVQPTMAPAAPDQLPTSAAQERPPVAVTADLAPELLPGVDDAVTDQNAAACPSLGAAAEVPSVALGANQLAVPLLSLTAEAEQHMDITPLPQAALIVLSPPGSPDQPSWAGNLASGGCSQLLNETTELTGIKGGTPPATQASTWSPLLLPLPPLNPADGEERGGSGGPSPLLRPAAAVQPERFNFPSRSGASDISRGMFLASGLPMNTSISSAGGQLNAPTLPAPGTPLSQHTSSAAAPAMAFIPMAHPLLSPAARPAHQHSSVEDGKSAFVQQQQQQQEAGSVAERIFSHHAPSGGLLTELFASQSWWQADGTFKLKTGRQAGQRRVVDVHSDTEPPARRTAWKQPEPPLSSLQPQLPHIVPGHELQPSCPQPQRPQIETPRGASPLPQCSPKATSEPQSHEAAARNASPHSVGQSHSLPNGMRLPALGRAMCLSSGSVHRD